VAASLKPLPSTFSPRDSAFGRAWHGLECKARGREVVGRESQTGVRFPRLGLKVVAARVSAMNDGPLR